MESFFRLAIVRVSRASGAIVEESVVANRLEVAALSLLLCLAVAVFWVDSYWHWTFVRYETADSFRQISSDLGTVVFGSGNGRRQRE